MKQGIHPEYKPATIVCACGNRIETKSTQEEIHVEICSVCHPFYTGKQRLVDTAGRVERFKRKYGSGRDVVESQKDGEEPGGDGESSAPEAEAEAEPQAEQPKKAKKAEAKKAKAEKAGAAPGDSDED